MLSSKLKTIFPSRCHIKNKVYSMIIDNGICINVTSTNLVRKLNVTTTKHSILYKLWWLNECADVIVTKYVLFSFSVKRYKNKILNDDVSMCAAYLLLQFDRKIKHDDFKNRYALEKDMKWYTFAPLLPRQMYED